MKIKNIKIAIKSNEDLLKDVQNIFGKLERGEKVKKHEGVSFENLETMRKVLTEERLKILKTIKEEKPLSIYALAKLVHRNLKNVSDDVHCLADIGFVELKKTKEGREKTTPTVNYNKILIEIAV
jgi:predicted transcriptional regulator